MGTDDSQENQGGETEYVRDERLAAKCENDPWTLDQPWDFSFPDSDRKNWHISPDFIDPMVDKFEEWCLKSAADAGKCDDWFHEVAKEIEDIQRLMHFADHLGGIGIPCYIDTTSSAAWIRAKAWLDVKMPAGFRESFEREVKGLSEKARDFLDWLRQLYREGDPVVWDNETQSSYAIAGFLGRVTEDHIQYLRYLSLQLPGRPKGRPTKTKVPRKRRGRKPNPLTKQRAAFARKWRKEGYTYPAILAKYQWRHRSDFEADADALRNALRRVDEAEKKAEYPDRDRD